MPRLTIKTQSRSLDFDVQDYESLVEVAGRLNTPLIFGCKSADCAVCAIKVLVNPESMSPAGEKEKDFLTAILAEPQERLACQCRVTGDVTIFCEE